MSESLANLQKKGGGMKGFDFFATPDVTYKNASMSLNATANIAVTQMPKYILFYLIAESSSYASEVGVVDVKNNSATRVGYYSSQWNETEGWLNWDSYITSISASSITIKQVWGANCRIMVQVYY